jgi:hypothetical protein
MLFFFVFTLSEELGQPSMVTDAHLQSAGFLPGGMFDRIVGKVLSSLQDTVLADHAVGEQDQVRAVAAAVRSARARILELPLGSLRLGVHGAAVRNVHEPERGERNRVVEVNAKAPQ